MYVFEYRSVKFVINSFIYLQSNLKIQATRIQHEIEDLQRRTENIKMKLTAEMKVSIHLVLPIHVLTLWRKVVNFNLVYIILND